MMTHDHTLQHRSQVPPEQTWDLTSLFASPAEWEAACQELESRLPYLSAYQGKLSEGPAVLLSFLNTGRYKEMDVKLFDYGFLREPLSYGASRRTAIIFKTPIHVPDFVLHPQDYTLERYTGVGIRATRLKNLALAASLSAGYHLHGEDEEGILKYFSRGERILFCNRQTKFYIGARGGEVFGFRVDRCMEHVSDYPFLVEMAEHMCREGVPGSVAP